VVREEKPVALRLHLVGQVVAEVQALLALAPVQVAHLVKDMQEVMEQVHLAVIMCQAAVVVAQAL
tara:strand:+ start:226 stop:420 length:195 start_codon:yes stop_codon:yes gene_type:complete